MKSRDSARKALTLPQWGTLIRSLRKNESWRIAVSGDRDVVSDVLKD